MAPGSAFSILAPFLGRKAKKYEKLETEDPEKKRQEATQEEINRLNCKIERLVHSMSRDDIDKADNPAEQCVVCCQARAVMQVAPCGHQCQCRLCFVHTIRQAVAGRDLPLKCLICNAKILRVKNNARSSSSAVTTENEVVHTTDVKSTGKFPKSVSGYSIGNGGANGLAQSSSNYSMSSGVSSMSTSSNGSRASVRSNVSIRSNASASSWFSIGSLSNFQGGKITIDSSSFTKPPRACYGSQGQLRVMQGHDLESLSCPKWMLGRSASQGDLRTCVASTEADNLIRLYYLPKAHSLSSCGKARPRPPRNLAPSVSTQSIKSCGSSVGTSPTTASSTPERSFKDLQGPDSPVQMPSPNTIDSRIRAIQGYLRVSTTSSDPEDEDIQTSPAPTSAPKTRLQITRENFRRSNSDGSGSNRSSLPPPKPLLRRLTVGDKPGHHFRSSRYAKSPEIAETTFTMTTIEEENEVTSSLKNLAQIED